MENAKSAARTEALPLLDRKPGQRYLRFLVKSAVFLVILAALSQIIVMPWLPTWGIAFAWALLSTLSLIGIMYPIVIVKTYRQVKFEKGGQFWKLNNGRIFSLILGFILAGILTAGLLTEAPRWSPIEWVLVVFSVPLYLGVSFIVRKYFWREYKPLFRDSGMVAWSSVITALLLCLAFLLIGFTPLGSQNDNLLRSILESMSTFEGSSSHLLVNWGYLSALADGVTQGEVSKLAEYSLPGALICRAILVSSAFFGVTSILSSLFLEKREIKRIITPLADLLNPSEERKVTPKFAVVAVVLPFCLIAGFFMADNAAADVESTEEYTYAKKLVCEKLGAAIYSSGDDNYDTTLMNESKAAAREASARLSEEAKESLEPLVNKAFDARKENTDAYLDWIFSYPTSGDKAQVDRGEAEDYVSSRFVELIGKNCNDAELSSALAEYTNQTTLLKQQYLEECKLEKVPKWLAEETKGGDPNFINEVFSSTDWLINMNHRFLDGNTDSAVNRAALSAVQGKDVYGENVDMVEKGKQPSYYLWNPRETYQTKYKADIEEAISTAREAWINEMN